ncbi:helix-turn-helix domain-containing protein [Gordonia caeni]|uniref:TetR/AcrR family transcriptional regulator n=1 Tax=Gordonia caeni TaxID=1007097 RepID=A0ABP7PTW4_9ACTN
MARRLTPEVRRSEILRRTREMIATQGAEGLSLRSVARWCGMSAPGLLHHFSSLQVLLEEVLAARDAEELAAFEAAMPADATLRQWTDTVVRVSMTRAAENRNFDALETRALADPEHPAHDYFARRYGLRPFPATVALAERDYPRNPAAVVELLGTVVDGLRLRWLRSDEVPDYAADWERIRDTLFAGFEQYR